MKKGFLLYIKILNNGLEKLFMKIILIILLLIIGYIVYKTKKAKSSSQIYQEKTVEVNDNRKHIDENTASSKESAPKESFEFEIDDDLLGLFSLKNSFWDSPAEALVYDALKSFIDKRYLIIPHVGLREIFYWDWKYDGKLTSKIKGMHFDFVIYHKSQMKPALIIEVLGGAHFDEQKPWIKQNDELKLKILKKLDISFITIDLSKSMPDEEVKKVTIETIKNKVPSREHYTVYCPKCGSVMVIRVNKSSGTMFYGCKKFHKNGGCDGRRNITEAAPLYDGINIKDFNSKKSD